jgi:hypothetical protein
MYGVMSYMGQLTKDEAKAAMKEALNEWLDKQWAQFGKWTAGGLMSMAIAGLAYAYSKTHGFIGK